MDPPSSRASMLRIALQTRVFALVSDVAQFLFPAGAARQHSPFARRDASRELAMAWPGLGVSAQDAMSGLLARLPVARALLHSCCHVPSGSLLPACPGLCPEDCLRPRTVCHCTPLKPCAVAYSGASAHSASPAC
jgi:hypothetical protein